MLYRLKDAPESLSLPIGILRRLSVHEYRTMGHFGEVTSVGSFEVFAPMQSHLVEAVRRTSLANMYLCLLPNSTNSILLYIFRPYAVGRHKGPLCISVLDECREIWLRRCYQGKVGRLIYSNARSSFRKSKEARGSGAPIMIVQSTVVLVLVVSKSCCQVLVVAGICVLHSS